MSEQPSETVVEEQPAQNVLQARDQNTSQAPQPTKQKQPLNIKTEDIIAVSRNHVDFGDCLPGSIHEAEVVFSQPHNLDPLMLNIRAICLNDELNNLPEYVFGLRRGSSNEFGDEIKVRIQQKIPIKLAVGVKIPSYPLERVEGVIIVEIIGIRLEPLLVHISLQIKIPKVQCIRELSSSTEQRIIKIMIKKKNKKQGKVPFRNCQNLKLHAQTEVIGLDKQCLVQSSPKAIIINPKAQFYITLLIRMTEQLRRQIDSNKGVYKVRKVLLIRIKDSSVYYHFPVEISFYEDDKTEGAADC